MIYQLLTSCEVTEIRFRASSLEGATTNMNLENYMMVQFQAKHCKSPPGIQHIDQLMFSTLVGVSVWLWPPKAVADAS